MTEMWTALEQYQPYADKNGHGESWKRMTTERTAMAIVGAAWGPDTGSDAAAAADEAYAAVAWVEADVERHAATAIEYINKAMEDKR